MAILLELLARRLVLAVKEQGHNVFVKTFFKDDIDLPPNVYYTVKVERHVLAVLDDEHVREIQK